jgi:hypothetical protein
MTDVKSFANKQVFCQFCDDAADAGKWWRKSTSKHAEKAAVSASSITIEGRNTRAKRASRARMALQTEREAGISV